MATLLKVDDSKIDKLERQIDNQVIQTGYQRSVDPNYPVFKVGDNVGTRKLFYIPRITLPGGTVKEGLDTLNVETANVHQVSTNSGYASQYRCVNGIDSLDGYDGTCPFDEIVTEANGVVNTEIEKFDAHVTNEPGQDERRKEALRKLYNIYGVVSRPMKQMAIPVAVFDLVGDEGINVAKDPDNPAKNKEPQMFWWIISANKFDTLIRDTLKSLSIKNPAGNYFIVNYPVNPKNKDDARYAGGNLTVTYLPVNDNDTFVKIAKQLDEFASNPQRPWTREKARETLTEFGFLEFNQIKSIANGAHTRLENLKKMNERPSIDSEITAGMTQSQLPAGLTDSMPSNFGGAPAQTVPQQTPNQVPNVTQYNGNVSDLLGGQQTQTQAPQQTQSAQTQAVQQGQAPVANNTGLPSNIPGMNF